MCLIVKYSSSMLKEPLVRNGMHQKSDGKKNMKIESSSDGLIVFLCVVPIESTWNVIL